MNTEDNTKEESSKTSPVDDPTRPSNEDNVMKVTPSKTEYKTTKMQSSTKEEESVSTKTKETGQSFKELVKSFGKKAKTMTEEKTKQLKDKSAQSMDTRKKNDGRDIPAMGANVEKVITVFEDTMTDIHKEDYEEQEKLLTGYKKLLEEQINVINARLNMIKRLKSGT
jgi:hypothetical protein